jgi:hypothetical protein
MRDCAAPSCHLKSRCIYPRAAAARPRAASKARIREFAARQRSPFIAVHGRQPLGHLGKNCRDLLRPLRLRLHKPHQFGCRARRLASARFFLSFARDTKLGSPSALERSSNRAHRTRRGSICASAIWRASSWISELAFAPAISHASPSTSAWWSRPPQSPDDEPGRRSAPGSRELSQRAS